jgi:hypothetical protein
VTILKLHIVFINPAVGSSQIYEVHNFRNIDLFIKINFDVNSVLGLLHRVAVDNISEVSEVHAAPNLQA